MKKCFSLIVLSILLSVQVIYSQSLTGNLESYLNSVIDVTPGSGGNDFRQPVTGQLTTWEEMMKLLLSGDLSQAREKAEELNYTILEYADNTSEIAENYFLIEENSSKSNYWGTYILNRNPKRKGLVIQAPHILYDTNTGRQAVYCFKRLGAFALFLSGTHRCNSSSSSDCSGTATACSSNYAPYKISDNAHNVLSVFQKTTEVLYDEVANTVFVQLHGFAKKSSDPYVIISNGTRITPEPDYISTLMSELQKIDYSITFEAPHLNTSWTRLIAFTNTQGRYINESGNPCSEDATECSGRFIHIEQEKSRLRADSEKWRKLYLALANTFPESTVSAKDLLVQNTSSLVVYPNPTSRMLNVSASGSFNASFYSSSGHFYGDFSSSSSSALFDLGNYAPGIYFMRITDRSGIKFKKIIITE